MKVIFAHTDFRIYWPARLEALYQYLKKKGIELEVIEIAGAGSPYGFAGFVSSRPSYWHCLFPDMKMEEISPGFANSSLYRKLDEIKPEIIFCGAIAFPSGAACVRWALKNRKKCIVFDDARLKDVPRGSVVNYIKRKIYSAVDSVFCPSPVWNETFRYYGFVDKQIFHGVNVVNNSYWSEPGQPLNNDLARGYFLMIGRQISRKNFLFSLQCYLEYTRRIGNPLQMVIIGDGPEREKLASFIKLNGLDDLVHLYSFANQEQLRSYYKQADWFILPSLYGETWGLVVNEAMASGLPVLVSNQAGCASTLVKEGENGFTFSPDDVKGLTELLIKAGSMDESQRRQMGLKSKEIISDWGLEKFCSGAYQSIQYVSEQKKKTPDLLGRIIISIWKGRYRMA